MCIITKFAKLGGNDIFPNVRVTLLVKLINKHMRKKTMQ